MALVRFGGGVGEIRGSIAGQTFSRNRSGAYVRNRTKPVNPSTDRQSAWRSDFGNVMNAYSALTPSQKADWATAATDWTWLNKLGEEFTPSGQQLFMKCASQLASCGISPNLVPPDGTLDTAPSVNGGNVVLETTAGVLSSFEITALTFSPNAEYVCIEASNKQSSSNLSNRTTYRQIVSGTDGATADIGAAYFAIYGDSLAVGDVVHLRIKAVDAFGVAGPWLYLTAVAEEAA